MNTHMYVYDLHVYIFVFVCAPIHISIHLYVHRVRSTARSWNLNILFTCTYAQIVTGRYSVPFDAALHAPYTQQASRIEVRRCDCQASQGTTQWSGSLRTSSPGTEIRNILNRAPTKTPPPSRVSSGANLHMCSRRGQHKGWWRATPSKSMRIMKIIGELACTSASKASGLTRSLHSLTVSHSPARWFEKPARSCCKAWMHVCAPDVLHAARLECFRHESQWEPARILSGSPATITGLTHTHFLKSSLKHVKEPRTYPFFFLSRECEYALHLFLSPRWQVCTAWSPAWWLSVRTTIITLRKFSRPGS